MLQNSPTNNMNKKIKFYIGGIHCTSCKTIIESELETTPGVQKITVNHQTGETEMEFDQNKIDQTEIFKTITKLNYQPSQKKFKNDKFSFWLPLVALVLIALVYFLINQFGGFEILSQLNGKNISLGIIFIIGILSGFHCVGMCGGFVVAYSTQNADKQRKNYLPHLEYNLGRFISYTLVGAILGGLGSFFGINPYFTGTITILAGTFMILLGLSYLTQWSLLEKVKLHTPQFIAKFVYKQSRQSKPKTPFVIGLLTGFMPCGPLQAIQLYALGTGDALTGALALGTFALGTSAVMFIFGLIISSLSQKNIRHLLKISGVLVILLGVLLISRGLVNFNLGFSNASNQNPEKTNESKIEYQEALMQVDNFGYSPTTIKLNPNKPVRWEINVTHMSGCTNAVEIPSLGIKRRLSYGENIIEFNLPKDVKEIKFSCGMKMIWGKFIIDQENNNINNQDLGESAASCGLTPEPCQK